MSRWKFRSELDRIDKSELEDFWDYCTSLKDYMATRCTGNVKSGNDLSISNKMICYTFAAMEWKAHSSRIDENNSRIDKIHDLFKEEYGAGKIFAEDACNRESSLHSYYAFTPGLVKTLSEIGIDTVGKLVDSKIEDFGKFRGIGSAKAKTIEEARRGIMACMEFKKNHPELFVEDEGDAE